jgi:putative peptidoglycan lipid II flippase
VSIGQISLLINTIFASYLANGSVSWLYYADRLMEFPTGVLGVALGTILLPSLAKSLRRSRPRVFAIAGLGAAAYASARSASALALAILAVPLDCHVVPAWRVRSASSHDDGTGFDRLQPWARGSDCREGAGAGFYARQDIRTPVRIGVMTLVATQSHESDVLSSAAACGACACDRPGACINAGLLYYKLRGALYSSHNPAGENSFCSSAPHCWPWDLRCGWCPEAPRAGWKDRSGRGRAPRRSRDRGAAVYFAALWLCGIRPAQFAKRRNETSWPRGCAVRLQLMPRECGWQGATS